MSVAVRKFIYYRAIANNSRGSGDVVGTRLALAVASYSYRETNSPSCPFTLHSLLPVVRRHL